MGLDDDYPDISYEELAVDALKAYLFDIDGDKKRMVWIPKSQIELDEKSKTFNIPRWLAEEKQLV